MTNEPTVKTPNSETEQSTSMVPTSQVAKKCLNVIEAYRKSGRDKAVLTCKILSALADTMPLLSESELNDMFGTYLSILEQHDRSIADAQDRNVSGDIEEEEDPTLGTKQAASLGPTNGTGKKQKQDDTDFPWVIREHLSDYQLGDSLRSMLKLLRIFARDLKFTKSSVINS